MRGPIDSITKYRQSTNTLRRMVERAYGSDLVPAVDERWAQELSFGMFNAAYRLRLKDGSVVALKIAPPPEVEVMTYEVGAMATELEALRLIRKHTTVPVPVVAYADSSHELCAADYFFMNYIDGENLAIAKETMPARDQIAYSEALGGINRELSSIHGTTFGPLTGQPDPNWHTAFMRMVEDVLADGERRRVDIGWDYDLLRKTINDNAAGLDDVTSPQLVEWDLWDGNVLIRDGTIVGIVDHERAFWGDPLIEHGFNGLGLPDFGDPASFVRGYGRAPLTETEQIRKHLYGIHLASIMIIETVFRATPDPQPYQWARAQLNQAMQNLGHTPRA